MPKDDPNLIYRLVGFVEYTKALENFDQLASSASVEELKVIDEIIQSEPEFKVFTNLSRRLEQGRSSLAEKSTGAGDNFSRHGFRWVTALARVELGAMLAGYSEHPTPFAAIAGTGYDMAEYKEMLIDGAKLHFWALTNDPDFVELMREFKPNGATLTYVRRLNVATAFVHAAGGSTARELSPLQREEVATYANNLDKGRAALRLGIQDYLSRVQSSSKAGAPGQVKELAELCNNGVCKQFGTSEGGGAAGNKNGAAK